MSSAKNSSGRCLRRNALSTNQPDRNENELEIPTNVLPLLHPSPRAPLTTIQDPQLSPQGLPNASDFEPKFNLVHHVDIKAEASGSGGHMLNFQVRGFSTPGEVRGKSELTSAHTTPARSVSKVFRGSGFPKVSRATANPLSWLPAQVPHFELDEDSSFWMDHNVQVLIRIRPISNTEKVSEDDSRCLRQDSAQDLTWLGHPVTRFTFDHVACETLSQEKLFKVVGLPMVENCMSGYNSCMFAYGQTGSGKTYTMMGAISLMDKHPTEDCGMTPRIFQYLFTRIREEEDARKDEKLKYNCKCSFLEIYNEQITDLLEPSSNNLQLREDQKKGVYVENLTECEVTNAEDVIELLMQGAANRKMAATHMNSESSRSHSVFTCVIESRWEKDSMIHIRFGRLNLVDLAGSERQKSSGAEGERLKEAANINKSLSTLGLVIMTLVDVAHGKHRHVPYRDSRLTFLLQDSLGGNSKTTIIANVSPSICSANETLSTLKFAQRAKLIQNNAKVNEDASGDVIALQQQIQKLKDQVSYLLQNQKVKMLQPSSVKFNLPDLREENSLFPGETVLTSYNYLVSPCKRTNYLEATLVGALRREKIAETSVTNLEAEIEHLNQLLQQREEDGQRTKLMLRICEDKIKRMGMLTDGLLCAEEYLLEENNALKEDINLLQRKIDRNPELTQIALENIRLLEKLRQFQNYYEHGEREILMAEVSALRDQLLDVYEGHCSLVNFHGSQATQDEVEVPMQEEADDLLKVLKDCRNEKFTRKANNFFSQLKKCVAPKQDILQVQDAYCEFSQGITDSNGGLQTADTIVDAQGKLSTFELEVDFVNESESSAEGCSWLLKTGKVQREHRLDELHHENSILRKAISAKDTEIIAVNKEWEQAILNLTSYLVDGFQLLQESSDQMGNILAFFSQRSSIGQQVEAAIEVFIKNENTISCLVKSLEDAQKAAMEMECKLSSLKRAAVSITAFYELKDCESTKEVLQLRTLLTEEISAIQDLENELRNMDRVVIEATKSSDVASIGIHNINRANVPESSSSQEYEEMLLSNPGSNSEEMMKQANKLLMKFEEAQETMKEADITLNELLRVNETTKHEVDSWKEAFEELMLERNILMEEVKQLKDLSVLQHLNNLEEIEEFVHTFERSFLQRNDVKEALKLISCDCNPIWEEVKRSIDNTRLSFEDIWFTNMEKQLVSLILYHSILEVNEDSNTYTNRQARVIPSYWRADLPLNLNYLLKGAAEFEEDTPDTASNSVFPVRNEDIKIGCIMQPSLCFEESLPLHWSSSKVFKKLGLISDTNEDHISSVCQIAGTDAFPESMLLKELNQKNFLLQGLLFDIRLLQESMSNARDIKDETYSIQTSLCKVQHELETKTAQLDHISVKFRKLEASLADIETVLSTSNSELDLANEKISLLADENFKWKLLLDEIYVDKGNLEKQLEEKQGVVMVLENEISQMSDIVDGRILSSIEDIEKRLAQMREERDKLQAEVYFLNDKLEASDALANEYEAIATEARQLSETSKVYAEQKEEEVKILERSVEELECTVTLLERKVYEMGEEVKAHHALREDLKLELEALRQRIQPVNENNKSLDAEIFNGGESTENKISRNADKMVREIFEMKRHIMILEAENKNQAKEIKQYKNYITEVVLHADAQASQYQGKYMTLETMIRKVKTGPSTSTSTTSMPNKMESSARARGSGSPFRCIVGLVQQVNSEKDRELSVARSRIEELEAIALNWQREVCMLKARLAATENMTYDVIRDLLGLKLDVTNYVNVVDQCQLQIFAEAQRPLNKPNSEQESLELREQITDFFRERKCWIEEIAEQQEKIQAAQATVGQLQQKEQCLTTKNEMLKMDKANLKRKIAELNEIVKGS